MDSLIKVELDLPHSDWYDLQEFIKDFPDAKIEIKAVRWNSAGSMPPPDQAWIYASASVIVGIFTAYFKFRRKKFVYHSKTGKFDLENYSSEDAVKAIKDVTRITEK